MKQEQQRHHFGSRSSAPRVIACVVCAGAAQCAVVGDAHAGKLLESAAASVGRGLARGAGLPTLPQAEASGHRLIGDLNDRMEQRITQIGGTLDTTVTQLDALKTSGLNQADGILQARITQIGGVLNTSIGSAVGGLDLVAKKRIAQLEQSGSLLIGQLNQDVTGQLDHVDQILQSRIGQLDDVVARSLADMDEILRQRIEQVDEIAERRLGNADVIVTRQGVALEKSLLQVGKWLGLVAFLVYAVIRGYGDFTRYWQDHEEQGKSKRENLLLSIGKVLGWTVGRLAVAGVCALVLNLVIQKIPTGSEDRLVTLTHQNETDFESSRQSLDFSRVGFYESQLQLLETDAKKRDFYRREARKYELARNALLRATLTQQGIRDELNEIATFEGSDATDADLLAIKAYLAYRQAELSDTRQDEYAAATLAVQALKATVPVANPGDTARAVFKPLAAGVLRALLQDPVPRSEMATHFAEFSDGLKQFGDATFIPLAHAAAYNQAVGTLNEKSSSGFIDMLEAHVRSKQARQALGKARVALKVSENGIVTAGLDEKELALATALNARFTAAGTVIDAWRAFDDALKQNPVLANSSAVYGVFSLNDAVLTQALWVRLNPAAEELAGPLKAISPPSMRLAVTPVRVEWARRYGASLGREAGWMFGFEEARRYEQFEGEVQELIAAYVALRVPEAAASTKKPAPKAPAGAAGVAENQVSPQLRAALAAATLGLYRGAAGARQAYGLELLGQGATENDQNLVLDEYNKRHLLLL